MTIQKVPTTCVDCNQVRMAKNYRIAPRCKSCAAKRWAAVKSAQNSRVWRCADCGIERVVPNSHPSSRCQPCANARIGRNARLIVGGLPSRRHPLYNVHNGMKQRCCNSKHKNWAYYGGKGVTVCAEWQDFRVFAAWAEATGWRPGLTIDRIDSSKGYCPENCEWVTPAENSRRAVIVREASRTGDKCV